MSAVTSLNLGQGSRMGVPGKEWWIIMKKMNMRAIMLVTSNDCGCDSIWISYDCRMSIKCVHDKLFHNLGSFQYRGDPAKISVNCKYVG